MEVLVYGIMRSVTLALMAVGFSFAYGISRLPNFAHGAFYVLTGFLTWTCLESWGINYALSMVISLVVLTVLGALVYQLFIIRVRGLPISEIIATYALGLAILEALRAKFVGAEFTTPQFIEGTVDIFGVPIDYQRLFIMAGGTLVIAGIWLFTHYTKTGLSLKGMAQDETAALTLGIDSDWSAAVALAIGSALAALAALLILPIGSIAAEEGYHVLISALAVCVVGGLGSWTGTIVAAFLLGFAGILTATYIGSAWQSVVVVVAIILTLILKPSGLFGKQKELEERV